MNSKPEKNLIPVSKTPVTAILMTAIIALTIVPNALAPVLIDPRPIRVRPVYVNLASRVNIPVDGNFRLVSANFTVPVHLNASIFFSVGTFIPPGQCCPGVYLELLSIDNGGLGAGGLGCGGVTSTFAGVLLTVSCFGRLNLTSGSHSVTLWLQNGGGTYVVEAGLSTAILIQFD